MRTSGKKHQVEQSMPQAAGRSGTSTIELPGRNVGTCLAEGLSSCGRSGDVAMGMRSRIGWMRRLMVLKEIDEARE